MREGHMTTNHLPLCSEASAAGADAGARGGAPSVRL